MKPPITQRNGADSITWRIERPKRCAEPRFHGEAEQACKREPAQHLDGPRADGAARDQHGRERERRRHERGNGGGDRDASRKPLAEELEPPLVHEPLDAIVTDRRPMRKVSVPPTTEPVAAVAANSQAWCGSRAASRMSTASTPNGRKKTSEASSAARSPRPNGEKNQANSGRRKPIRTPGVQLRFPRAAPDPSGPQACRAAQGPVTTTPGGARRGRPAAGSGGPQEEKKGAFRRLTGASEAPESDHTCLFPGSPSEPSRAGTFPPRRFRRSTHVQISLMRNALLR